VKLSRALTLVELLVSLTVLLLLAGLMSAAAHNALRSARQGEVLSDLRQIGTAVLMYREGEGGYPPSRLDPVVVSGFLKPVSILKISSDPYPDGYARRVYDCGFDRPRDKTTLVTSYEDVFQWSDFPPHHYWLEEMVRPIDPDPALVVTRVFGSHDGSDTSGCAGTVTAFMGLTLRFHEDGSARRRVFWDGSRPGLRDRFCWPALFSNLPPDVVCKRKRRPPSESD
jgi:type II secretory pathway pseudopilin PulG